MTRKIVVLASLVVFVIGFSGCATGRREKELEMQGLRNQLSVLESQCQSKGAEIDSLKDALARHQEKETQESVTFASKKKALAKVKPLPKTKQVQLALKNAGFYAGSIDGKKGRLTKDALKAFQRANNIPVTGRADRQTWALLRRYQARKVK